MLDRHAGEPTHHLVGRRALRDALLQMAKVGLERRRVQSVLATKVAVERRGRDPEIPGDVLEARPGVPVPVEPRPRRGEDRRPSVPRSRAHLVRHGASLGQRVRRHRRQKLGAMLVNRL